MADDGEIDVMGDFDFKLEYVFSIDYKCFSVQKEKPLLFSHGIIFLNP